jgi:hypothetical protein
MPKIHNVKLELLRPGPAHNQLLSPLTPYLALCGADGPVTVHMPFEHRQLLSRLERLRYATEGIEIAAGQRETELRDLGEAIGRVLAQVPALMTELGRALSEERGLMHLRLSISAFELALVPFELAIGMDGFPGSGAPLFVQSIAPITVTREVRRGRPLPVEWNRKPRILFAFASPGELPAVPAQTHLEALRRAIDPWVRWKASPENRLHEVKSILTVLPNASLQQLRKACAETDYTHVHILAHGDRIGRDDDRHYGLVLCRDGYSSQKDWVDGEALATALTAKDSMSNTALRPTLVSLATCDSGHPGSVLTPGGSIAHALHAGGIPWVIASQFPLWMKASSVAVEMLYRGLLRGDDPRWVLYALRQRLRTDSAKTHDWGSIVAYAVIPWDFERQVEAFRNRQNRERIEFKLDKAEEILLFKRSPSGGASTTLPQGFVAPEELYTDIRQDLQRWHAELSGSAGAAIAELLGISAASEKRIGNFYDEERIAAHKQGTTAETRTQAEQAKECYEAALKLYQQALQADPKKHWVTTQYLSLLAILAEEGHYAELAKQYSSCWTAAQWIATQELQKASKETKAWALGTLAELELLGVVYGGPTFDREQAKKTIMAYCREIYTVVGSDAFPVYSTRRQFQRYITYWPRTEWTGLAAAAVQALGDGESWRGRVYLGNDG